MSMSRPRGMQSRDNAQHMTSSSRDCFKCGYVHDRAAICPARGKKCSGCGKIGHFIKVCHGRKQFASPVNAIQVDDDK